MIRSHSTNFTDVFLRFTNVYSHSQHLKILRTIDFLHDDPPSYVQIELTELQASGVLVSKFTSATPVNFYRQLKHL